MNKRLLMPLALLILSACAALGVPTAKGFDQQLADAYGVHTAVLQAVAIGVDNGQLSSSDGTAINNTAMNARVLLDAARAAEKAGDMTSAQGKLGLATALLAQLQSYLNTHTGSK